VAFITVMNALQRNDTGADAVLANDRQVYLTVVYDLERRVLLWVGDDRTEEAVRPFFTKEMGTL
jgi:hypothetical protein